MDSVEIQQRFVNYYESLDFRSLPRAPMLHPSIPMSFVMSAGLIQVETSLAHAEDRDGDKFVLVQECFRHFDLDRVGTDDYHLSLFQMPGAFVFGPDGKATTIERMWTLATSILGIDKEHLWASYFRGGEVLNEHIPSDKIAHQTWLDVGIPESHIVGLGATDNYWIQGGGIEGMQTPRKAGPNTELFYDRGVEYACGSECQPSCKCGRFIEFSNSLFICREQNSQDESLHPMAEPFAETVIGSERVAMILQNAPSVFDTVNYHPIMETIHRFVHAPRAAQALITESERVVADHLKALYILIGDGAPPPGKNGRERIIKLLIRGVATRQILLGIQSPEFLPTLITCISQAFPSAVRAAPEIEKRMLSYFFTESQRFLKTIDQGQRRLERYLKENEGFTLSGAQIVTLEKDKGLPRLLTAMMLREKGLAFETEEYKKALAIWRRQPHN